MDSIWIDFLTKSLPLVVTLLTAIVGLIVTALKYKKQKYEIAILEEQNKLAANNSDKLSVEEVAEIRAILQKVKEKC